MSDALRWPLGSFGADVAIRWAIEGVRAAPRNAAPRRSADPPYKEKWLVDQRCGFRALAFRTFTPPDEAKVGDAWAYVDRLSNGEIITKRRFRTILEAHDFAKAALKRALLRAGKDDCW
jgi:hypothetical protein